MFHFFDFIEKNDKVVKYMNTLDTQQDENLCLQEQ